MTTHEYGTIEGTEPTAYGAHQPRTVIHTTKTGDDSDVSMMSEIGDGVFVAWSECRKCSLRIGACQCPAGPTEPPYMQKWRDSRFERSLNTRPDPSYDLLPSVIEWLEERGYNVSKAGDVGPLGPESYGNDRISGIDDEPDPANQALEVGMVRCRTCGEPYSEFGDGWNGECPNCADKTYALEFGDDDDDDEPPIFEQVTGEKPRDLDDAVRPEAVDAGLDATLAQIRALKQAQQEQA